MTLLHSNASMHELSPRIAATGAIACAAELWPSDSLGTPSPYSRDNFTA